MNEVGDRVLAVSDADPDTKVLNIFGVGVYVGEEVPPPGLDGVFIDDWPNPKIVLDGGGVIWGAQCWWGDESNLEEYRKAGFEIVTVPLPDAVPVTPEDE